MNPGNDDEDFAKLVNEYPPPDGAASSRQVREAPAPAYQGGHKGQGHEDSTQKNSIQKKPGRKKRKGGMAIPELDLHGKTEDQAIAALNRFLDRERHGDRDVTVHIIHGKGHRSADGPVLTDAVRSWLGSKSAREAGIKDWRPGRDGFIEGGSGITICTLKPGRDIDK